MAESADDKPRPPRALPTLASVQASNETLLTELRGARLDIDTIKTAVKAIRAQVEPPEADPDEVKISFMAPATPTPVPESRPSRAAQAMQASRTGTKLLGRYTAYFTAAITIIAQVLSMWNDPRSGPLVRGLLILASAVSGSEPPPSELPAPVWSPPGYRP